MNKLVEKFEKEKRWVMYKMEMVKGKMSKVPYQTNGRKAASTRESEWSYYEEVKNTKGFDGYGIIFTPDRKLLGIDIDHCLNKKLEVEHSEKENILKLLAIANTYVELSPSKTGLHFYFEIPESFTPEACKKADLPYETYSGSRYFTVTHLPYGEEKPIRTVTPQEMSNILSVIGYPWKDKQIKKVIDIPIEIDDQKLLDKMFASKNGEKIKDLYNFTGDNSEKDMAFCSHLAFWTGRNAQQMDRIWLASPLGQRKKVQTRKENYRTPTIDKAIAGCTAIYETPKMKQEKELKTLDIDLMYIINKEKEKVYIQNTENICRILRGHPNFQTRLRYDTFKNILEIKTNIWRGIEDNDSVNYQTSISVLFPCFSKVGKEMVYDAMIKIAKENSVDSAADYIKSLCWDKNARLDTWLVNTYGTPDDIYHRAVGSNWIKGLVKRIIKPGCKFDYVLVLEGEQGTKKSTSLYVLGGSWHVETTMSTDNKDFFMQFSGKAIIEFSEGETLSRTEVKRMKAIITMQFDKYRPPYERASQEFPRHCVFAMTTNQTEYLKDETGNRRWLPITLTKDADIDWLSANREQLFAEAYHRVFNLKETIYEFPKEETLAEQQRRRIHDANADLIVEWYSNLSQTKRDDGITINQVYKDALGVSYNKPLDRYNEMLLADVLKDVLKLTKKRKMLGGRQLNRWYDETGIEIESAKELTAEEILVNGF